MRELVSVAFVLTCVCMGAYIRGGFPHLRRAATWSEGKFKSSRNAISSNKHPISKLFTVENIKKKNKFDEISGVDENVVNITGFFIIIATNIF